MIKAVNVGIIVVLAALGAYLAGIIDQAQMFLLCGIFGFPTVQALRELFLAQSKITRVVTVLGVLLTAVFGYGYLTEAGWASLEKFGFIIAIVFGVQVVALGRGIARSAGRTVAQLS